MVYYTCSLIEFFFSSSSRNGARVDGRDASNLGLQYISVLYASYKG